MKRIAKFYKVSENQFMTDRNIKQEGKAMSITYNKHTVIVPIDNVNMEYLNALLEAKGELIKKALGICDTQMVVGTDAVYFPWFDETLDEETFLVYSKFITAICDISVKQKPITAKPRKENENFSFRCFLLRLGFIGDKFKADRKILLKNFLSPVKRIRNLEMDHHEMLKTDFHYEDVPISNFLMDNIDMLYFMVCLVPETNAYGKATGCFVYKNRRVFAFHYNIHTPEAKGPRHSNQMTTIHELMLDSSDGMDLVKRVDTDFGNDAFKDHTPIDHLDEEARTLRMLMKSLQTYCRQQDYCKKLCKLDKAHIKWENGL